MVGRTVLVIVEVVGGIVNLIPKEGSAVLVEEGSDIIVNEVDGLVVKTGTAVVTVGKDVAAVGSEV